MLPTRILFHSEFVVLVGRRYFQVDTYTTAVQGTTVCLEIAMGKNGDTVLKINRMLLLRRMLDIEQHLQVRCRYSINIVKWSC